MHIRFWGAPRAAVVLLVLGSWAACREQSESASIEDLTWSGQVQDSAGVVVVSNPSRGVWTDQTRWTVHHDLAIGADLSNAPEYEFGSIADMDADTDGRIYVLDNQNGQVSVFEPNGQFAFSFGKLGKGPGEFSIEAFAVRVNSDSTVAVRDGINQRDNLFTTDGAFLRAVPLTGPFKESAALTRGNRIERATASDWDGLLHVGKDGSILDTITTFQYDRTKRGGALSSVARGGAANTIEIPLLPSLPAWGVSSDGRVVSGVSNQYRIEVRRPGGGLEMLIGKDHDSLVMNSDARERVLGRLRELLRGAGLSDQAVASVLVRFTYVPPDSLPAFADIVGGPTGTIWVQKVLPIDSMTANATLDALNAGSASWGVFCNDGRYLGDVSLPIGFTLMRIKKLFIYGIEPDQLDVQRPVRLVIRPAPAASQGSVSC